VLPDLSLKLIDGELDASQVDVLLQQLKSVGEENLGLAMTFTLVSHLREQLSELVKQREAKRRADEKERERRELEVRLILSYLRARC
jgi:regulator of replication initiation timing